MKNLKKVLALVLAVVMIFGVMSLTSATFTDDAKISNTEAVEVMAGLQILTGYTDGSYQPEGNVTREEMATIICKMLLGPEVAKTLTQGTSNFKDVAATRWSAGYIEYCANLGIIDGYGDGTFNPAGNVTIGEAAKMLLVAAGIKGTYTGADWLVNVTANACKAGIITTDVDVRKTATRDQVALYAFNALTYTEVTGTYLYNVYAQDGKTLLASYTDAAQAYFFAQTQSGIVRLAAKSTDSIGYKVFKLVKEVGEDLYGRPANTWFIDGNGNFKFDAPLYNDANTILAVQGDKFIYQAAAAAAAAPTHERIPNSKYAEMVAAYQAAGFSVYEKMFNWHTMKYEAGTTPVDARTFTNDTANGTITEIYLDYAKKTATILTIDEHVSTIARITSHPATPTKGAYTEYVLEDGANFIVYSSHVKAAVESDTGAITGTPAVGAVVAYTVGNGGYINAEVLTTTVSGQIANATYGHGQYDIEKITVNNTPYTVSYFAETSTNDEGAAAFKAGLNAVIYLDKYGYIAYVDYTQAVDYAQVNTIGVYDVKTTSGALTGLYAIESQLVFADGTTKNVTVDAIVDTQGVAHTAKEIATNTMYGYNSANGASLPELVLDAFTYAVNATTGNYTLTMIPAEAQENATIYASQFFAKIGGQFPYVANNATTFVVRTGTAATGYTWTVYTGFEKLPSLTADKATVTVVDKNHDNVQDLVFIESNYDFVATNEYVYITSSYPTVNYVNGLVVSYTYPTTDGTITVSAQGLINYQWTEYVKGFGVVTHSATVSALNFVGSEITCTKAHTTYTGCADGHRATTFNGVGLYKVTQKDAAGAVTLLEKVDVRTVVAPGYEGLIKVEKIANEDAVAPIQENWHYNSNSKLVVFVDGVPTDGFTFETLYANSYEKDEYSVQAEIIPQTVVQGNTVVATDWIGTMYVTITLNH